MNNLIYVSPVASSVPFNNATNGFTATNVQSAIEEAQSFISNTEVSATGNTTTTSSSDVLINSMTITPAAGTYLVWFSTSLECSSSGSDIFVSIYSGGSQVAHTERKATCFPTGLTLGGSTLALPMASQGIVTVNGSQAIEARWRRTGGTATAHQRTMNIIRVL